MFVLNKNGSYSWPVIFSVPADGGKVEKKSFEVTYKRLPQSKLKKVLDEVEESKVTDIDFCKDVVIGWKGIQDEDGNELQFSESSLESLLDYPMLAKTLVLTYIESLSGAKAKN